MLFTEKKSKKTVDGKEVGKKIVDGKETGKT